MSEYSDMDYCEFQSFKTNYQITMHVLGSKKTHYFDGLFEIQNSYGCKITNDSAAEITFSNAFDM